MQIAIVVPDEQVDEIDRLVPSVYRSRADAVRVAIDAMLRARRKEAIDRQYLDALDAASSNSVDDSPRLGVGDAEPESWKDIPW